MLVESRKHLSIGALIKMLSLIVNIGGGLLEKIVPGLRLWTQLMKLARIASALIVSIYSRNSTSTWDPARFNVNHICIEE
jgi:hypothetical protein